MLADVVLFLRCPHCGAGLEPNGRSLRCHTRHSFDVARQGYVNLLPGDARPGTGDTAEMVAARERFLGTGHYTPVARLVAREAARAVAGTAGGTDGPGCVVDVGAGTGYYLARVLDELPDHVGLALDISKFALRRAARAHPRIGAAVCDAWRPLPVRDAAAALVLNVFAPRDGAEIRRILRPGGALVVATPTPRHLAELVTMLELLSVDERKQERLEEKLGPHLEPVDRHTHEETMPLGHADVEALVAMGPSAWHTDPAALGARIAALPETLEVTLSVTVSVYRRP